jgi:hypothetical protein
MGQRVPPTAWFTRQRTLGRCKWEPIYISFFSGVVATIQLAFESRTVGAAHTKSPHKHKLPHELPHPHTVARS